MGEICALHNMNDYMHFIGIVLLYIIFIVVVIYFIYNLYCKHNTIIEKYNTSTDAAQIGTIETQEPSGYYDSGKSNQKILNHIRNNIENIPNHDITNDNIHNIMRNQRNCTIRFQEDKCTENSDSNCQYTFKDWKESANFPNKYITSTSHNIDIRNDNGFLNLSCFKEPKGDGKDYVYNIFNDGISVIRALPFNNNNNPTYVSQANNNTGNYISMFFNTNPHNTAEAKAANVSNILNDICSYQHPIPPSLPSGTLYKLNLSKNGNNYKIDSITTATITNGVISDLSESNINNNSLSSIGSEIKLSYDATKGITMQKGIRLKNLSVNIYKFDFNKFCNDKKIIGFSKAQYIDLYTANIYNYQNNAANTFFPANGVVIMNSQDVTAFNNLFNTNDGINNINGLYGVNITTTEITKKINDKIIDRINNIKKTFNGTKVANKKLIEQNKINEQNKLNSLENIKNTQQNNVNTDIQNIFNGNFITNDSNLRVSANNLQLESFYNFNKEFFDTGAATTTSTTNDKCIITNGAGTSANITLKAGMIYNNNNEIWSSLNGGDRAKFLVEFKGKANYEKLTSSEEPTATPSVPKQIPIDKYQSHTLTFEGSSGYTSTTDGNQRTYTINFPENVVADILVVGGGGCGADATWVGGGGAGGLIYYRKQLQGTYTIKVGKGGGPQDTTEDQQSTINSGKNGKNSEILDSGGNVLFRAIGGSMGTRQIGTGFQIQVFEGGSTGGSGYRDTNPLYSGVGNLSSQNIINGSAVSIINAGGTASNTDRYNNTPYGVDEYGNQYGMFGHRGGTYPSGTAHRGSGGGGAGGVGINGDAALTNSSDGGVGKNMSSIFGTNVGENGWFAGGGGGSGLYDLGVGGMGGGGDGKKDVNGEDGMAGTGGGGGGYTHDAVTTYFTGGSGGSGIVIIRYYVMSSITHKYLAFTTPTTYSVNFPVNTTCDILAINNSQYIKTSGVILNGSYNVVVGSTSKIQQNSTDLYVPNTNLNITDSITGASITYSANTPKVIIRYSMGTTTTTTITTPVQPYGYLKYDATANDWIITEIPTIPTNLSQLTGTLPYTSITGTPTIPSNLSQLTGTLPYSSITGTPTIPTIPANYDSLYYKKSDLVKIEERTGYLVSAFNGVYTYEATFKIQTNLILNEYNRPQFQYRYWLSMSIADSSLSHNYWAGFVFYDQKSATFTTRSAVSNTSGWTLSLLWGDLGVNYLKVVFTHNENLAQYLNVTFC